MQKLRFLAPLGALALMSAAAGGQSNNGRIRLAQLETLPALHLMKAPSASPATYIALRGGAMVSPRGAGLVGADFSLPNSNVGNGAWHVRIDADAIIKANFGGVNTAIPVTVDLLSYAPSGGPSGHNIYYGGGLGAVFGGRSVFDGKLVLGTELTSKIGAELNVHFTEHDTLLTLLARLHM